MSIDTGYDYETWVCLHKDLQVGGCGLFKDIKTFSCRSCEQLQKTSVRIAAYSTRFEPGTSWMRLKHFRYYNMCGFDSEEVKCYSLHLSSLLHWKLVESAISNRLLECVSGINKSEEIKWHLFHHLVANLNSAVEAFLVLLVLFCPALSA
jgi:hypothetical protein